jgi:hypothetical protein
LQNHQTLSSLPPLLEGGEVDGRIVVTDDSQETSLPESETGSEQQSESGHSISPPLATSPRRKRKRNDVEDSGASKSTKPATKESSPEEEGAFNPYDEAGAISS